MSSEKLPPIKMLVLSLTGQCNFACRYCYAAEHDKHLLTPALALAAVDLVQQRNQGAPFILQLSGGEPLLNWECLTKVVEYALSHKLPVRLQLQTNGSLLSDAKAQYLYQHQVAIGVSMDGKPKVTDKLRLMQNGQGAALAIVRGLEVLKRNNLGCGVTCVVTSENVDELEGIVDFAYYMGNIYTLGFDLLRGQGRGGQLQPATEAQMEVAIRRVYARAEALSKIVGYKLNFTQVTKACGPRRTGGFTHCRAMTGEALFVDAVGKLYACASFVDNPDFYLGHVNTGIDLELVEQVQARVQQAMSFCTQCASFDSCGGGCVARWYGQGRYEPYRSECALKKASIMQFKKVKNNA